MSIIPKCLTDDQIDNFVNNVNKTSDEILGESKFKIPNPALPGLGLLVKLQIKIFEKSILVNFLPIIKGKQILTEAFTKLRVLKFIRERTEEVAELLRNPIQTLLNQAVNIPLAQDFPFPVALLFGIRTSSGDIQNLISDINTVGNDVQSVNTLLNYKIEFDSILDPPPGLITSPDRSPDNLQQMKVNFTSESGERDSPLLFLKPGDYFSLDFENFTNTYQVSEIEIQTNFIQLFFQLQATSSPSFVSQQEKVFVPGFSSVSLRISRKISLRQFLNEQGKLIIPLTAFGISLPISLELGNFDRLSETNPTYKFVKKLEAETNLDFSKVLSDMIDGIFPVIDWEEIQKDPRFRSSQEDSKLEMINLARLIQIGTDNPLFMIRMILNYLKLLLLPIEVVVSVFKTILSQISNPISLIRIIFLIISNPLRFLCDIISDAFLKFLRVYLEPPLAPLIQWNELVQDPVDRGRGLKPLFSDLICGRFKNKLANYNPDSNFFVQESAKLKIPPGENPIVQLSYNLTQNPIPDLGEVSLQSPILSQNTSMRFSTITDTVENGLAYLTSLGIGDTFYLSSNGQFQNFRVSGKNLIENNNQTYFEYLVQPVNVTEVYATQENQQLQSAFNGIVSDQFKASISVNNPNKTFLFILERYLPMKAIAAWESIKGIFSITVALASEIPSLIPLCFKCIFSGNRNTQQTPSSLTQEGSSDFLQGFISSLDIELDPDRRNFGEYKSGEGREASEEFFREIQLKEINPGSPGGSEKTPNTEGGIQEVFLDLQKARQAEGKSTRVYRSNLPVEFQSNFRWDSLTLNQIGENLKVLSRVAYELSFRATSSSQENSNTIIDFLASLNPLTSIANDIRNESQNELVNKSIPITVWALTENGESEFKIINNGPLYQSFLDYSFFTKYDPEIETTEFRFKASQVRYYVNFNFRFAKDILLPALRD
jgi:hypothetical protein